MVKITCFFVEDFANSSLLPSIFASNQMILPHRKSNPDLFRGYLSLRRRAARKRESSYPCRLRLGVVPVLYANMASLLLEM
jgi:hypothetical protein